MFRFFVLIFLVERIEEMWFVVFLLYYIFYNIILRLNMFVFLLYIFFWRWIFGVMYIGDLVSVFEILVCGLDSLILVSFIKFLFVS